ncbi:MAG TPA: ABC transporter substrate-binding protein [Chloroflexia bacterium]|nr:ABC transporter substrate-binding protein [Chloroflexia bacterium]
MIPRALLIRTGILLGLVGSGLAGCGDPPPPTAIPAPTAVPSPSPRPIGATFPGAHARSLKAPAQLVQPGTLTVGTDVGYPPMEFVDDQGRITGIDIDIAAEIANRLGLQLSVVAYNFDEIIPALNRNQFDVVVSSISITPERRAVVNFVPYLDTGRAVQVRQGNPQGIKTLDDLSGKTAVAEQGTADERILQTLNTRLGAAGKPKVTVRTYPTDDAAVEQVRTGQADAVLHEYVVAAYDTKLHPQDFAVAIPSYEPISLGIAIAKLNKDMNDSIQAAITAMQADGTLDAMQQRWGLKLPTAP